MTRTRSITLIGTAAAALLIAVAAGCGGGGGDTPNAAAADAKTPSGQTATVDVAGSRLGNILVDTNGRTLYLFQSDSPTASTCSGECASDWPPLRASGSPTVSEGANASLVTTVKRSDGKPQVAYNGHPLYLYEGDQAPGDTNGQGLNLFGALWYAVSPNGDQVSGQPAGTSTGGGGY